MNTRGHPDPYLRRLAAAAGLAVLVAVVAGLLGPRSEPGQQWYEHTGIEGPTLLLEDIDIVTDRDVARTDAARSLPEATIGVQAPVTEDIQVKDPENPVPLEQPEGRDGTSTQPLRRADPQLSATIADGDQVEMNRPAQQSSQFVLLHSVSPAYPAGVEPALRRREIVVRVNMYVDESGRVSQAYVDRNNGGAAFEQAVLRAVTQWVYKPLVLEGKPSGFWDLLYFVFRAGPGSGGGAIDD